MQGFRCIVIGALACFLMAAGGATTVPAAQLPLRAGAWHRLDLSPVSAGWNGPPAQAELMKEFGLRSSQQAQYQVHGHRLRVRAWVFGDASGAYGAFTFLHPMGSRVFALTPLPSQAATKGEHTIFYQDHWLLDIAGSATPRELTTLAAALPRVPGGSRALPLLPHHLPRRGYVADTVRYVEGPAGLRQAAAWLPASAVGFDQDAEVVTGQYRLAGAPAQLAVVSYPTPQIAASHLQLLQARLADAELHRSGSLLAVWHGASSPAAAALLREVQFRPLVTWSRPLGAEALPSLIVGIFVLVGLIIVVCIGVGLTTGGLRIVLAKLFPRRFSAYPRPKFISLHLR